MTITSNIPGRIRVRDQRLTRAEVAEQIRTGLLAMNGVTEVTVGIRTGSLLVTYSTAQPCLQGIMEFFSAKLGEEVDNGSSCGCSLRIKNVLTSGAPLRRNAVNYGMLASLLTSMVGILVGLKKLHYAAGALFLAFFGIHLFERRRAMFA